MTAGVISGRPDKANEMIREVVRTELRRIREFNESRQPYQKAVIQNWIAQTDGSGIAGRSGSVVGKGTVTLYYIDVATATLTTVKDNLGADVTATAHNLAEEPVGANVYIMLKQEMGSGQLFVDFEECVPAIGYGQMSLGTPPAARPDLGLTFDVIDAFDTIGPGPVGMTLNTTTGEFSYTQKGIWNLSLSASLEFLPVSNAGRVTSIRIWSVTDSAEIYRQTYGVGRNQEVLTIAQVFNSVIDDSNVNDVFRWEIGGGDTFTTVEWESLFFDTALIQAL